MLQPACPVELAKVAKEPSYLPQCQWVKDEYSGYSPDRAQAGQAAFVLP